MSLKDVYKTASGAFGVDGYSFKQKNLLKRLDKLDNKGICQGLCLCHAGMAKQGIKFKGGGENGMHSLFEYANHAQQHFETMGNPDDLNAVTAMYNHLSKSFNLKIKTIREFSCATGDVANMTQWAWGRAPGYFQILLPNHVVSFHLGDGVNYFDPNYGMSEFNTFNLFENFMGFYHTHPDFLTAYGLGHPMPSPRPVFVVGLE